MMTDPFKRYLSQVRQELVCPGRDRRRLFAQAEKLVVDFAAENPQASYDDIAVAFGAPRDFATAMTADLDQEQVVKTKRGRKRLRSVIVAGVALVLVLISVFWYSKYRESQDFNENGTLIIFPAQQMTEEDLEAFLQQPAEDSPELLGG